MYDNKERLLPELSASLERIKELTGGSSDILINRFITPLSQV